MSISDRPQPGTWLLSPKELDEVVADLLKNVRIDRNHDIPYVAGYNKQNTICYIDHQMPKGFNYRGKFILTDRYLILHERIEASLEAGPPPLHYLLAHQVALRTERDAVIADGVPWAEYNQFMTKQVKLIGSRPSYPNCPRDLDLEPYKDEADRKTLRKMRFGDANVQPPPVTAQPSRAIH